MLHSPQHNNKIKHLRERCLRLIHNDKLSSYKKHIEKDGPVFVHHRNIQRLTIKMFQIKCGQSLEIATGIFKQTTRQDNFRQKRDFIIPSVNTVYHGSKSSCYLSPKICEIIPVKI